MSNKRSIVITHSYGSLNGLHAINGMYKDRNIKYVERFVPMAPPFSGAMQPLLGAIGYFNVLDLAFNTLGYSIKDQNLMFNTNPGIWALMLK